MRPEKWKACETHDSHTIATRETHKRRVPLLFALERGWEERRAGDERKREGGGAKKRVRRGHDGKTGRGII